METPFLGRMEPMSSSKHPSQHRYPLELRERAIRMVQEATAESGERFGVVTRVARQLGFRTESLRYWEKQPEIARVHKDNFAVYGAHELWRQLNREGIEVGRDRVWRLMRALHLEGVRRGKRKRTTLAAEVAERPVDLVDRQFKAEAPNRLWVADL